MSPEPVTSNALQGVGVVTIGRNEGERLQRCLRSLIAQSPGPIVYVDSGSTDGSVEFARSIGVTTVSLDLSSPFTMARARNVGFDALAQQHPDLTWVQFVDGDCEVEAGWIAQGRRELENRSDLAATCGFRRERKPEASVYNRLIDMEWRGPIGEIKACGGDAIYRIAAFKGAGGFNPSLIAGEEPELCVRLRQAGWKITRLDAAMTVHDANITTLGQWWRRVVRSGHASAEGAALHGAPPERHKVRETWNSLTYGLFIPAVWLGAGSVLVVSGGSSPAVLLFGGISTLAVLAYARQLARIHRTRRRSGNSPEEAWLYARYCVLGKVAEAIGAITYYANRARGRRSGLIEYKTPARAPPQP